MQKLLTARFDFSECHPERSSATRGPGESAFDSLG